MKLWQARWDGVEEGILKRLVTCTFCQVSFPPAEQPARLNHCKEEDKENLREENTSGVRQQDCLVEEKEEFKELITEEVVGSKVEQKLIS